MGTMSQCTQEVAITACKSGECAHSFSNMTRSPADGSDCSAGGSGLCSCSELINARQISTMSQCTQEVAITACKSGECAHSLSNMKRSPADGSDCSAGGSGLCSCSELINARQISTMSQCTQEVAITACKSGECAH